MNTLKYEFVEFIPETLYDGVIYISTEFRTASHKCCCGCGEEVVTPLSPTDWKLIFDGVSVSLIPSIGNWNFNCKSHYWIKENSIDWAGNWSSERIKLGQGDDLLNKQEYYQQEIKPNDTVKKVRFLKRFWRKVMSWF